MMPWFAWAYLAVLAGCCGVIGFCAWDIGRMARRMRKGNR